MNTQEIFHRKAELVCYNLCCYEYHGGQFTFDCSLHPVGRKVCSLTWQYAQSSMPTVYLSSARKAKSTGVHFFTSNT